MNKNPFSSIRRPKNLRNMKIMVTSDFCANFILSQGNPGHSTALMTWLHFPLMSSENLSAK